MRPSDSSVIATLPHLQLAKPFQAGPSVTSVVAQEHIVKCNVEDAGKIPDLPLAAPDSVGIASRPNTLVS